MSIVFFSDSESVTTVSFRRNLPGTIIFTIIYLAELICFCSGVVTLILCFKPWHRESGYSVNIDLLTNMAALTVLSAISSILAGHALYRPLQSSSGKTAMYSFGAFISAIGGLIGHFVYFGQDVGLAIHGPVSLILSICFIFDRNGWIGSVINPFIKTNDLNSNNNQNLKNSSHGIRQLNQMTIPMSPATGKPQ